MTSSPTHFKFTVNLKTAKELGFTVPPAILARAAVPLAVPERCEPRNPRCGGGARQSQGRIPADILPGPSNPTHKQLAGAMRSPERRASLRCPRIRVLRRSPAIAAGFATNLARRGSNITGVVMLAPELDGKRVDVLHRTVPSARRIAALARSRQLEASNVAEMEKAAIQADLELITFYAAAPEEFPAAFMRMHEAGVEAGRRR
jgi:hypothetical protein